MKGNNNGRIFYLCFYADSEVSEQAIVFPTVLKKIEYIVEAFKNTGKEVVLLSAIRSKKGRLNDYQKRIDDKEVHYYFHSTASENRLLRYFDTQRQLNQIKKFIKKELRQEDRLVIYHSMHYYHLLKSFRKYNPVLEVEEIYGDVFHNNRMRQKEYKVFLATYSYIFPTSLLAKKLKVGNYALVHGTYKNERVIQNRLFNDGRIHCVYAGTLDLDKGACNAIQAAKYLDGRYAIHIIGFGSKEQENLLNKQIQKVKNATVCGISYDGYKSGQEYFQFIQSCDMGLCTQNVNAQFNDTSFPSKVLSYLTNGLRVVSVRIKALETSAVNDLLYYYNENSPEAIAKAIQNIDMSQPYDSRKKIEELDQQFKKDLKALLR